MAMSTRARLIRYTLDLLAIALVLLVAAGCEISVLDTLADSGATADADPPVDDGDPAGNPPGSNDLDPAPPTEDEDGSADSPDESPPAPEPEEDPAGDPPPDASVEQPPAEDAADEDSPAEDPPSESADVPENAYCADLADWPPEWAVFEEEVLALINEHRAAGADCGSHGEFAPAVPLSMSAALRCAARSHSMDMNVRDFFSHTNPDGDGPGERLSYAGYDGLGWGENIAWGYPSPAAVVTGWMGSDGHCANIMRRDFTLIGVGYYAGNYWTQTFGRD
jgi:uncharacterized protein YkwD